MGLGLTKLGEKALNGEHESAWQEINYDEFQNSAGRHSISRTWRELDKVKMRHTESSGRGARNIDALLLYDSLKVVDGKVFWTDAALEHVRQEGYSLSGPCNFGMTSLDLLEDYLVDRGYLDETSSEDVI